jgi:protein subunit release factor A
MQVYTRPYSTSFGGYHINIRETLSVTVYVPSEYCVRASKGAQPHRSKGATLKVFTLRLSEYTRLQYVFNISKCRKDSLDVPRP